VKKGQAKKLTSKWRGPYVVMGRQGENNYFVCSKDNLKDVQVIHVDCMKVYYNPQEPEGELEVEEILDWWLNGNGEREYLLKWRAMTDRYNKWVPAKEVHAPEVVQWFVRRQQGAESDLVRTKTRDVSFSD